MRLIHPKRVASRSAGLALGRAAFMATLAAASVASGGALTARADEPGGSPRTDGEGVTAWRFDEAPRADAAPYDPAGRRDPFVDPRPEARPVSPHDPRGFLIEEIALRGIVATGERTVALILGPDGRPYFVSPGQRFYDGVLVAVRDATLTFERDAGAQPNVPGRLVHMPLHPGTE